MYDELTGRETAEPTPDYIVVELETGRAYGRAETFSQAARLQLSLGLRAKTEIIELGA